MVAPDIIKLGYPSFNEMNNEMCLLFIAKYVSQLVTKGNNRKWLDESTFLLMSTPSDIAFVATLLKNSESVWRMPSRETSPGKPLYTSGQKTKREFGGTA